MENVFRKIFWKTKFSGNCSCSNGKLMFQWKIIMFIELLTKFSEGSVSWIILKFIFLIPVFTYSQGDLINKMK